MVTLKTITTIELSNICNLACQYCINRLLVEEPCRMPGTMLDTVFDRTLEVLKELVRQGTQREINMNGNGESFLDPQLVARVRRTKEIMGDRKVAICTNGVNVSYEVCAALKDAGLDQLDLSPHSPWHARRAAQIMAQVRIPGILNNGPILYSHNWAGQLESENRIECRLELECEQLKQGMGYVLTEGNITPCCFDYRNLGVFGTVFDDGILDRPIRPYALCRTCHQKIPEALVAQFEMEDQAADQHFVRARA